MFVSRPNIAHVGVVGGKAYAAPFVVVGNPGPKGSEEADARLIAAAPDMLAALQKAKELYTSYGLEAISPECGAWINSVRAALSKAGLPQ
ncbi:hypothetical protein NKI13_24490 [Mesorhizobium australicum]|uniref:hypothetical protein n=1 Tax=Mesorhizobium australicum TaxID=536018 RepID=UPI003339ACCD